MMEGVLLAAVSALLGGALALAARRHAVLLELTRTFAFTAAAGVVGFHLLPEVLPQLGPTALLWIAAGFVLPWLLEIGARAFGPNLLARQGIRGMRVAAEVGFAALLFHSLFEGLALLATLPLRENRTDLEIAIVAHHAPLTAAVALPFLDLLGRRATLVRVSLVALAGVLGVLGGSLLPGLATGADAGLVQRGTAVVAGALLHVVADEIREQHFSSVGARALDLLAAAAGVAFAGVGALLEVRTTYAIAGFARAVTALALGVAPALIASIAAEVLSRRRPVLHQLRAPFEGLFATAALLGWVAAVVRALLSALFVVSGRLLRLDEPVPRAIPLHGELTRRGPWLVVLLFLAASVVVLAPPDWFGQLGPLGTVLVAASITLAARASASGGAMLVCSLVHGGLSVGLALPFLALGSVRIRHLSPVRRAVAAAAGFCAALVAGVALHRLPALRGTTRMVEAVLAHAHEPVLSQLASAPAAAACAVLLSALAVALAFRSGVRGWFAPFRHGDSHDHGAQAEEHEHAAAGAP